MANPHQGAVSLVTAKGAYTLRITIRACVEVELLTGQTVHQIVAGVKRKRPADVRAWLWASLRDPHPELAPDPPMGPEIIGELIDQCGGIRSVWPALMALIAVNNDPGEQLGTKKSGKADGPPKDDWRALMRESWQAGIDPVVFWALSLRELWDLRAVLGHKARDQQEQTITQAWWTVNLWVGSHKSNGKLEVADLRELLRIHDRPSPEELDRRLRFMAAWLGKPIRKKKKPKGTA